jgi:hypothetical protein
MPVRTRNAVVWTNHSWGLSAAQRGPCRPHYHGTGPRIASHVIVSPHADTRTPPMHAPTPMHMHTYTHAHAQLHLHLHKHIAVDMSFPLMRFTATATTTSHTLSHQTTDPPTRPPIHPPFHPRKITHPITHPSSRRLTHHPPTHPPNSPTHPHHPHHPPACTHVRYIPALFSGQENLTIELVGMEQDPGTAVRRAAARAYSGGRRTVLIIDAVSDDDLAAVAKCAADLLAKSTVRGGACTWPHSILRPACLHVMCTVG